MAVKVLLYGEGATDYGIKAYGSAEWIPGAIVFLIKNCALKLGIDIEFAYAEKPMIDGNKRLKLSRRHLQGLEGKAIPARYFRQYAIQQGYRCGIFYCDTDKTETGSNTDETACKREFSRIYGEVKEGLGGEGNASVWYGIPMVALKMIECWLLSDEYAFLKSFGSIPLNPGLPSRPELIWGAKKDRESNYPKYYMDRVLEQYQEESGREAFVMIAENTDLKTLCRKCPISFPVFYEDFRKLVNAV